MNDVTAESAIAAVIEQAGARLGLAPENLTVESVERHEFPDAALGCPRAGAFYAQVVTPGYVVTVRSPDHQLEYRISAHDGSLLLCRER